MTRGRLNDGAEFWYGTVNDVRIYRRVLPQNDIKAIVQGAPVPDYQALAALAE